MPQLAVRDDLARNRVRRIRLLLGLGVQVRLGFQRVNLRVLIYMRRRSLVLSESYV